MVACDHPERKAPPSLDEVDAAGTRAVRPFRGGAPPTTRRGGRPSDHDGRPRCPSPRSRGRARMRARFRPSSWHRAGRNAAPSAGRWRDRARGRGSRAPSARTARRRSRQPPPARPRARFARLEREHDGKVTSVHGVTRSRTGRCGSGRCRSRPTGDRTARRTVGGSGRRASGSRAPRPAGSTDAGTARPAARDVTWPPAGARTPTAA